MVRWRFQSFPLQWISFFCLVPVLLTHANDSGHSLSLSQPTEATVERNKIVISGSTPTEGIDYITELAAEAIPQLLNNSMLPDVDADGVKILKMRVEKFEKPTLRSHFIKGAGVGINLYLPHVVISAACEISSFLTTQRGKLRGEIQNLSIVMEVHMQRNESTKMNIITVSLLVLFTKSSLSLPKHRNLG
ncbi:unnamed protein product [Enterobius vermicularis]|uniref:BPI1 domain-containing protein n=1 Tax=Enterobius vermicularis TaxID=51028 RepID=A0A0N4VDI8_ENTVE|nr:unnamed protein product [Enterobius vermicularis]